MHVWACPPPPGDDYLFYRHPEKQITPDHKRLDEWYTKLLQKGIAERIILNNLVRILVNNAFKSYFKSSIDENSRS